MTQLTWLITGCTSGLGGEFARAILGRGDRVIATGRNDAVQRLASLKEIGAATLDLDVTAPQSEIDQQVQKALDVYGTIDVLVNNAGYIEAGMVEEIR
jgi:NAD(P)-dependent dehydrogenase (short-subunit alcohol dehydrogenase family)